MSKDKASFGGRTGSPLKLALLKLRQFLNQEVSLCHMLFI
jgi:hypothetical protein